MDKEKILNKIFIVDGNKRETLKDRQLERLNSESNILKAINKVEKKSVNIKSKVNSFTLERLKKGLENTQMSNAIDNDVDIIAANSIVNKLKNI